MNALKTLFLRENTPNSFILFSSHTHLIIFIILFSLGQNLLANDLKPSSEVINKDTVISLGIESLDEQNKNRINLDPIDTIEFEYAKEQLFTDEKFNLEAQPSEKNSELLFLNKADLIVQSNNMNSPEYQELLSKEIVIPTSTNNIELIEIMHQKIGPEGLNEFLLIKERKLQRAAKFLFFLEQAKVKYSRKRNPDYTKINELLNGMNNEHFRTADYLIGDRTAVYNISLIHARGYSFSETIIEWLGKKKKFKKLQNKKGFYYYFGVGFSVHLTRINNKISIQFSLNKDKRIGNKLMTPFGIFSVGISAMRTLESANNNSRVQRAKFLTTPVTTLFDGDYKGFTVPVIAKNILPLALGMVVSGESERKRIILKTPSPKLFLTNILSQSKTLLKKTSFKPKTIIRSCRDIL